MISLQEKYPLQEINFLRAIGYREKVPSARKKMFYMYSLMIHKTTENWKVNYQNVAEFCYTKALQ